MVLVKVSELYIGNGYGTSATIEFLLNGEVVHSEHFSGKILTVGEAPYVRRVMLDSHEYDNTRLSDVRDGRVFEYWLEDKL